MNIFFVVGCSSDTGFSTPFPVHTLKQSNGYIKFEDHQIYYETKGEGLPIIFLHGGYLHCGMWEQQMDFFAAKGFRAISYDDLGHGKTRDGTVKVFGHEVLLQILDSLNIQKAHLVGLSWGAMIAVDFCLQHPEKVEKMVLISSGLNGWEYFQDSLAAMNNQLRQKAKEQADTTNFVELFMRNWTDGPSQKTDRLDSSLRNSIRQIMTKTVTAHWGKNWSSLVQNPPARLQLEQIKQPVLLVKGSLDALDIHQITDIYQKKLDNAYRFDIPNVAHTLTMEKPDLLNEVLLDFLQF
ncbi:MAG: alpha/beta hydrolase [Chitinophagales bacterium]